MIFSVFDHNTRSFDYFEAPGTSVNYGARGTRYRAPTQKPINGLGYMPESLALPLPPNARHVGSGSKAKGIIATRGEVRLETALAGLSGADGVVAIATDALAEPGESVVLLKSPFAQTVAAACVAAVVGVVVQRALAPKRKR